MRDCGYELSVLRDIRFYGINTVYCLPTVFCLFFDCLHIFLTTHITSFFGTLDICLEWRLYEGVLQRWLL